MLFFLSPALLWKKKDGSQWVTVLLKSTKYTKHLLNVKHPATETEDSGE